MFSVTDKSFFRNFARCNRNEFRHFDRTFFVLSSKILFDRFVRHVIAISKFEFCLLVCRGKFIPYKSMIDVYERRYRDGACAFKQI